jgi:hypothetical protein
MARLTFKDLQALSPLEFLKRAQNVSAVGPIFTGYATPDPQFPCTFKHGALYPKKTNSKEIFSNSAAATFPHIWISMASRFTRKQSKTNDAAALYKP